ncbi:serine O-acetyltransferase [Membranihabitans marinus]|uniref:serine O-acetyltransferase n=1 Tax=Membranihabitans marinus TaxID=1227546 RepID=UPI001F21CBE9|nr:serine O-acetyltransferase [Membranihabitans marinus]
MKYTFLETLFKEHQRLRKMPSPDVVCKLMNMSLEMLFPELSNQEYKSLEEFKGQMDELHQDYISMFQSLHLDTSPEELAQKVFDQIPVLKAKLEMDAEAICKGDPAATDTKEVKRSYPGFYAIAVYRFAHLLHSLKLPYIPRILTEYAHSKTGIDIHPNAVIGDSFCIDHGSGVVIGETVVIGNHVKIYQNVTLGALSVDKTYASIKRHPTIEDHVIIYSGATILGGETIIGEHSIIGGNVWLTKSVPSHSKIYYQPNLKNNSKHSISNSSNILSD